MSSFEPNVIALVGGLGARRTRTDSDTDSDTAYTCTHGIGRRMRGGLKGQPFTQYPQSMQLAEMKSTMRWSDGRSRRARARLEASRILTVHAAVLADQPLEVASVAIVPLGEPHQRPAVGAQVGRVVVDTDVVADLLAEIVPLHASDLARLATDALGDIDHLGDLGHRLRRGQCRDRR